MARITQKGQVTIPREIREQFALRPGTDVEFIARNHEVLIVKRKAENRFLKWVGRGSKKRTEDIDTFIDQMRGRDDG